MPDEGNWNVPEKTRGVYPIRDTASEGLFSSFKFEIGHKSHDTRLLDGLFNLFNARPNR